MKSFRDPVTGVLKAFGFVAANAQGDLAQDEADDFALEPGKWQLVAGVWVAYTAPLSKAAGAAVVQKYLDDAAQAHGYDSILSLCTYATSANVTWQKEGQYGCNLRDSCWDAAQTMQDEAVAGNWPTAGAKQVPTAADVLAAMPTIVWPV